MQLDLDSVTPFIRQALAEDIGTGDVTSRLLITPEATASLQIVARHDMVVCGLEVAAQCFIVHDGEIDCRLLQADGDAVAAGTHLMSVTGSARAILEAERTALNFMQRLSGVATLSRLYVEAVAGTTVTLLDTRKTLPGWRMLDKYATRTGGVQNHRMRLDDRILIKDNHIGVVGSVVEAVARARAGAPEGMVIEVECDTLHQVNEALSAAPDVIMLDNMPLAHLREAVVLAGGRIPLEASGNVSLETVRNIAETGVDYISIGRITHSAPAADIGLDMTLKA